MMTSALLRGGFAFVIVRLRGCVPLKPLLVQKPGQIHNEHQVEADHARVEKRGVVGQVLHFQGQVECRRNHGEPFCPVLAQPQPVTLRESNQRIGKAQRDQLAGMMVGSLGHRLNEQPREAPLRVNPMPEQKSVCRHMEISVAQREQPAGGGERKQSFGRLKQCDGA